jgi:hypothetical protein
LREAYRLRVFENRILRKMFGFTRDKTTGDWKRLHNSSINIIRVIKSRRMEWPRHVTRVGDRRGAYWVVMEGPEGRRPLRRPRSR